METSTFLHNDIGFKYYSEFEQVDESVRLPSRWSDFRGYGVVDMAKDTISISGIKEFNIEIEEENGKATLSINILYWDYQTGTYYDVEFKEVEDQSVSEIKIFKREMKERTPIEMDFVGIARCREIVNQAREMSQKKVAYIFPMKLCIDSFFQALERIS